MDFGLSVSVTIGAALPGIFFEVSAEIRADDPSDMPLESLAELFAALGIEVAASCVGTKAAGFGTTGTVKNERRVAAEEIGRLVFICPFELCPFELRESDNGIFSPTCGRFAFAVETAGTLATFALTGSVEKYKAHIAEKMPEFPEAGLEPRTNPRVEAGAAFGFADWMVVITVNFEPMEAQNANSVDIDASDAPTCNSSER